MIIVIIFVQIGQHCMLFFVSLFMSSLAKKRIENCGLQDRVTVICTEISSDRYMNQLVGYLQFYNAHFDTVFSMLPSGDGLIQFVGFHFVFEVDYPLSTATSNSMYKTTSLFHSRI